MLGTGTDKARCRRRVIAGRLAGLYAVTPDTADTAELVALVEAALAGGACAIQYRNKSATPALRLAQGSALARLRARHSVLYIVNDDAALAAAVNADGVHLGEDDGEIHTARRIVGPERIIGVSCYDDFGLARRAVDAGADYVAFGSFHSSGVKPHARRAGVILLERAKSLGVPVVAIGGITAANAGELLGAGANAVAVISDVFGRGSAAEVESAARAICAVWRAAGGGD